MPLSEVEIKFPPHSKDSLYQTSKTQGANEQTQAECAVSHRGMFPR